MKAPAGRDEILETFYAEHVGALLRNSSAWLRRLVASYTIIDADTIQLRMSVDFDLAECEEGLRYLSELKHKRRRCPKELREKIPFLLPIGLYTDTYVGFDLRDCGESRVSLITNEERDQIIRSEQFGNQMNEHLNYEQFGRHSVEPLDTTKPAETSSA